MWFDISSPCLLRHHALPFSFLTCPAIRLAHFIMCLKQGTMCTYISYKHHLTACRLFMFLVSCLSLHGGNLRSGSQLKLFIFFTYTSKGDLCFDKHEKPKKLKKKTQQAPSMPGTFSFPPSVSSCCILIALSLRPSLPRNFRKKIIYLFCVLWLLGLETGLSGAETG